MHCYSLNCLLSIKNEQVYKMVTFLFQPRDFSILDTRFCSKEFVLLLNKAKSLFASKRSVETLQFNTNQSSPLPKFSSLWMRSQ